MDDDNTARFVATRLNYDLRDGAHEVRLATAEPGDNYLCLQRRTAPGDHGDDQRIQVEFNDPGTAGYDLVQDCYLDRHELTLELSRPLAGKHRIVVTLEVADAAFERFFTGMKAVFADKAHLLHRGKALS